MRPPLRCEKQILWIRHNAMHCPVENMGTTMHQYCEEQKASKAILGFVEVPWLNFYSHQHFKKEFAKVFVFHDLAE